MPCRDARIDSVAHAATVMTTNDRTRDEKTTFKQMNARALTAALVVLLLVIALPAVGGRTAHPPDSHSSLPHLASGAPIPAAGAPGDALALTPPEPGSPARFAREPDGGIGREQTKPPLQPPR